MKLFGSTRAKAAEAVRHGEVTFSVFGLGKMGLPLAVSIAEAGAQVVGADINPTVVAEVNAGRSHVAGEPELPELVSKHASKGTLVATTDLADAARRSDVMVVIVPTLLHATKEPDLSAVEAVCREIARGLQPGDLVIQEATLPPGSTERVMRPILERGSGLKAGLDFGIAFCPERTLSGRAVHDIRQGHPKIVGGVDRLSTEAAAGIYTAVNRKGVLTLSSATAAEAVKVFEGVYRDVNIALANELAMACEELGIDAHEVFERANTLPFCHLHDPGCGVGGHCIPVYPYFISQRVKSPTPLILTARGVNDRMPSYTIGLLEGALRAGGTSLSGGKVLVLGLTYRAGVNETRFSPGMEIARLLVDRGVEVHTYDPLVAPPPGASAITAADLQTATGWDGVIATLDDPLYKALPWKDIARGSRQRVIVDARRGLQDGALEGLGFTVLYVGGAGNLAALRRA